MSNQFVFDEVLYNILQELQDPEIKDKGPIIQAAIARLRERSAESQEIMGFYQTIKEK